MNRILTGLSFYLGFAPKFSKLAFDRKGLGGNPVEADFSGQSWLVTGASGGIGREIVLQAARRGARVVAAARSAPKLDELAAVEVNAGVLEPLVTDLALMSQVGTAVDELNARDRRFDVLINNVGVLLNDFATTDEGFEASFATNLLNHYLLTELLIERGLLGSGSCVINMSSGGMYSTGLVPELLNTTDPRQYDGVMAYARHKRAQVELTHHWNDRYGPELVFQVMHPGWVDTEGVKTALPGFRRLFRRILRTPDQGADTAIWLAANRPDPPPEGIWLDREVQPEHVSRHTRSEPALRHQLVDRMDAWIRQDR